MSEFIRQAIRDGGLIRAGKRAAKAAGQPDPAPPRSEAPPAPAARP